MASFNFHLRESVRAGYSEGRVFIRLIHERRVCEITTPYRVFPDEWDGAGNGLVIHAGSGQRSLRLKDISERMRCDSERIRRIIFRLDASGCYTIDELKRELEAATRSDMLTGYARTLAQSLDGNGQYRTARAYLTAVRGLLRFCGQNDLPLDHISPGVIRRYEQWMKDQGKSMNTISFYMRNLRAIYHKAVNGNVIQAHASYPFKGVYTGIPLTRKRALDELEVRRIREMDSLCGKRPSSGLRLTERQRDAYAYFMFSFYARGMSSIDMAYLKKANVRSGKISYCRKKTGGNISITLSSELRTIIKYFSRWTSGSPYVFPIIDDHKSNARLQYENFLRRQNLLLKELAQVSGVQKPLSTHWARHSWATIAKKNGAPIACISEGLGHRDEKTTRIYLDSFDASAIDQVSMIVKRAINKSRPKTDKYTISGAYL